MDDREAAGIVTIFFGIITLFISLAAELVGMGNPAQFVNLQIGGAVLGTMIIIVGLSLSFQD